MGPFASPVLLGSGFLRRLLLLLLFPLLACGEYALPVVTSSPVGCWRLEGGGWEPELAPGPVRAAARVPFGVELGERAFLGTVSDVDRGWHRFDPERAGEARLMLPDTTLRVAWWRADADSVGVGNHNLRAGWYLAAAVRGERLGGEMRWVRYGDGGVVESLHRAPVTGLREDCRALR